MLSNKTTPTHFPGMIFCTIVLFNSISSKHIYILNNIFTFAILEHFDFFQTGNNAYHPLKSNPQKHSRSWQVFRKRSYHLLNFFFFFLFDPKRDFVVKKLSSIGVHCKPEFVFWLGCHSTGEFDR